MSAPESPGSVWWRLAAAAANAADTMTLAETTADGLGADGGSGEATRLLADEEELEEEEEVREVSQSVERDITLPRRMLAAKRGVEEERWRPVNVDEDLPSVLPGTSSAIRPSAATARVAALYPATADAAGPPNNLFLETEDDI